MNGPPAQITSSGYTYDAAGNMTKDGTHSYTYDAEGNILTVDGGANGQYVYDALNRRVAAQTTAGAFEYLYDYAGRQTSRWKTASNSADVGRIYWDNRQIAFRAGDGNIYFDHQDYLGTEKIRTTSTGAVAASYVSLPWGDNYSANVVDSYGDEDILHFAGLDQDNSASGAAMSEHAQFRNYSFTQGRWLSPDPYDGSYDLTNPQSFNRYSYALNNPLSFVDPLGLEDSDCGDDDSCSSDGGLGGTPGSGGGGSYGADGGAGGYPPGTILQDQNGNYYIVNSDGSISPFASQSVTASLGDNSGFWGGVFALENSFISGVGTAQKIAQKAVCAAASGTGLSSMPAALNSTVGFGVGGSAGIGVYGGVSIGGGVMAVADQQGNVGIAISLQGNPGQGVWGVGAMGGGQLMRSNAATIGGLSGTAPDFGVGIGAGDLAAGFDYSASGGTWSGTATVGVGAGLVAHSAGVNLSHTWVPVSVNCIN